MYVRHKTIEASKTLVEEVTVTRLYINGDFSGGLDGGHNEGGVLNHPEELALDDTGLTDGSSSQAGKHDGSNRIP